MQLVLFHSRWPALFLSDGCVQVFHSFFWPLEFTVPGRDNNKCYSKIICNKLDSVRFFHTVEWIETEQRPVSWAPKFARWMMDLFCFAASSRWVPLPGPKCRRGDARLRCSHEMSSHQGAAGRHHRHPPDLCWGKKTTLCVLFWHSVTRWFGSLWSFFFFQTPV